MSKESRVFPVRVSGDGRYFVDAQGAPFFFLGDTQWELVRAFSYEQAQRILKDRAAKGFSAVLVMLLGVGASGTEDGNADGRYENAYGQRPWHDDDPLRPNEPYFENVDRVIRFAATVGIAIVLGVYHSRTGPRNPIQPDNARRWARWLGERYRSYPNLSWSMYPRAEPGSLGILRELAEGIREGAGDAQLITAHPDPSPASSGSVAHAERWLSFNTIQTYKWVDLIPPMIEADRQRTPAKPVVMAEGAYEAGIEYGFPVTPLWVRRQAWYTALCGASHCYGHNDCWRVWATWEAALDAPGATHLGVLRRTLTGLGEWWKLQPDRTLVVSDPPSGDARILCLTARHPEGTWAIAYIAAPGSVSIRGALRDSGGSLSARWVDPRSGAQVPGGTVGGSKDVSIATPSGWEDALLILE
jgi:hypothetical protein